MDVVCTAFEGQLYLIYKISTNVYVYGGMGKPDLAR